MLDNISGWPQPIPFENNNNNNNNNNISSIMLPFDTG
jgi:hypothetical protein